MADELRLVFIILGALVLGALLVHGLWTVRKNAGQPKHRYYDEQAAGAADDKAEGFDELGVGPVRVIKAGDKTATDKPSVSPAKPAELKRAENITLKRPSVDKTEVQNELQFDESKEPQLNFSALAEDEDADLRNETDFTLESQAEPDAEPEPKAETADEPAEVLILYVLLPEGKEMKGPDLLSSLLTLGFKYGDMDIFHRHLDNAGSGSVLFSLANMFNPGTFDLENIDKLGTRGVSLFMTLPGPGEPLQNFNLMHNAAKKLAEEFGGQVLDGQRSVLTVQTVRHYVDKIREFQRQQLIHG